MKVISASKLNIKNPNTGQFESVNTVANATTEEYVKSITDAGQEVLESIPIKYTTLINNVNHLSNSIDLNSSKITAEGQRIDTLVALDQTNPSVNTELVDLRIGTDGTVYGSAGNAVRTQLNKINENIQNQIETISQIKDFTSIYFDNETRLLHFYDDNGFDVYDPVLIEGGGSGGGGGSSTSVIRLVNNTGISTFNAASGSQVSISFTFTSTDDDVPTGDGTCQITVNGVVQSTTTIRQGSNTLNITEYLKAGTNTVRVKCSDVYGNFKLLVYTISVIDLYMTSTFDDTIAYNGEIQFKYVPYGLIEKTIHILVDNVEVATNVTSATGKQFTAIINNLTHGIHKIDAYITSSMNGMELESDHLLYDAICVQDGARTPMISSVYLKNTADQGSLLSIPYSVYDPTSLESDISLIISQNGQVYSTQNITVDRTRQYWNTRNYPTGQVDFIIKYKNIQKTHTLTINEPDIQIESITNDLELYLSSAGRSNNESNPAKWEYKGITTTFSNMNWDSTGWVVDEDGDTVLRLNGDAKAEIQFKPFATDLKVYGKTIELEFAIRDVNNREAVVIECLDGGIGFSVTADTAKFISEQSNISCNYCDEEKLRISFVIESRNEYRMLQIYLNGILSGAKQYPISDIFQQHNPVNIKIGSPYCGIDLYTVRSYTTALTFTEITENYIADTPDIIRKYEMYDANNIYDEYKQLSYEELKKRIPVLTIIGDLPQSKGDKKNVTTKFEHNTNSDLNFVDTCSIDVQGTSSQWYVRKNYKLKYKNEHLHAEDQLPAKVFCTKADYAESTSTHNTQMANFIDTLYTSKTPAQLVDSKCRTTIYGYPIAIFHQSDESAEPEFIGKYNFNYDKGAENVFFGTGFDVESWEFSNNTSDDCNFLAPLSDNWADNFEARYPEDASIERFRIVHDWIASTTGDVDKFKNEFEDHFDLNSMLIYYVVTFVFLMVDQRAKNMFFTYWDDTKKWSTWFYDNDTCLGINNEGQLVFDYYHEDSDTLEGANIYNGQNSTLWVNFKQAYAKEIKETYQDLRNNNKLTYDIILDYFNNRGASKWSESVYNEDSDFKYISMLRSDNDASNLYQIRGNGIQHLKYFMSNRLNYCDSKWYASDYANNYVSLRIYTPATWTGIRPNANITVTPFSNMYAGVKYKANGTLQQSRATKNVPVTFIAPTETFNDTETAIYGASELSSLGDLAPLYCGTINVSKASKLTHLKIGDSTAGYSNGNLTDLSVGTNKLLRVLDVRNCPNLTDPLGLSGCPNIEEIYATGSGITGIELANSGYLKIIHLPGTITNLTLKNQLYIEDLTIEDYSNITTLNIENCPTLDEYDILTRGTNLRRVRITNVDWEFNDITTLLNFANSGLGGIDENGYNTEKPQISGTCHIPELTGNDMAVLKAAYPYLTITFDRLTTNLVYKSEDGTTELYREVVINGVVSNDPVTAGIVTAPVKDSTVQYDYTYGGWSTTPNSEPEEDILNSILVDTTLYLAYTKTVRKYTVNFYNEETLIESRLVPYGTMVEYTGTEPANQDSENFMFNGWRPELTTVTGPVNYYARYKYIGSYTRELIRRTISGDYTNNRITEIENHTFYNCQRLTSVTAPNVTSIGNSAFSACINLTEINYPEVTTLGTYTFFTCSGVETVNLPKLTDVKNNTFGGCSKVKVFDLPCVTSIDIFGFTNCTNLEALILRSETLCTLINKAAFNSTKISEGTGYIYVPRALVNTYKAATNWVTFADSIRAIEDYPDITGGDN